MINIKTSGYSISAEGHAGYAEYGKDIVCSAVTGLLYAAAECVRKNEASGKIVTMEVTLESGHAVIKCVPDRAYCGELKIVFETIITGLEIVADMYPEYVHIENF